MVRLPACTLYCGVRMMLAIRSSFDTYEMSFAMSYADETLAASSPDGSAYRVFVRPSSIAFSFIRSMKPALPYGDTRASARAAALSDAINAR